MVLSCSWVLNGARLTVRLVAVVARIVSAVKTWSAPMASSGTCKTVSGTVSAYLTGIVTVSTFCLLVSWRKAGNLLF